MYTTAYDNYSLEEQYMLQFGGEDFTRLEIDVYSTNNDTRFRNIPNIQPVQPISSLPTLSVPMAAKDGSITVRERPTDFNEPGKYKWGGELMKIVRVTPIFGRRGAAHKVIGWDGWDEDGRKFGIYPEDRHALRVAGYDLSWTSGRVEAKVEIYVIDDYDAAETAAGRIGIVMPPDNNSVPQLIIDELL